MSEYVEKLDYLEETKALIREAIVEKGVDVSESDSFRSYAEKIEEITTGGGSGEIPRGKQLTRDDFPLSNAVKERRIAAPFTFYDYDGTVLGQYTKAEIDAMTSEDDFPTPIGSTEYPLTFVGWNWALDQLKAEPYGINVGAIYAHVLESGYQSPLSVFMDVTEEVTFNMKGLSSYYFGIKNRNTGEMTIPYWKGTTTNSVTLPVGKYVVLLSNNADGSISGPIGTISSMDLFTDTKADKYIKGVCIGNTATYFSGSYIAKRKLPVDFVCGNAPISTTGHLNVCPLECDFAAYAKANATTVYCANSKKLSFNTPQGICIDNADKVEELLLPKGVSVKNLGNSYSTSNLWYSPAASLKELYVYGGTINSNSLEYIYIDDASTSMQFYGAPNLEEVYLPDRLVSYSFTNCSKLAKIRLPEGKTTVNSLTSGITSIYIPDGVTTIQDSFKGCSQLSQVYLPDSVTLIKGNSFANSGLSLDNVRFPGNCTIEASYSSSGVFDNTPTTDARPFEKLNWILGSTFYQPFSHCKYLTKIPPIPPVTHINNAFIDCERLVGPVEIPDTVTEMGYTFQRCKSLIGEIVVPPKVTKLDNTFDTCEKLQSVILLEGLTKIGNNCFNNCYALTTITIPSTVTDMNANSLFTGCSNLKEYHMKPTTPPTLSSYAFGYSSTLSNTSAKIYVPYSADHSILAAYQTATNWSKWAAYMVEEEPTT